MADEKKSSGKSKALTQLEKDVYETFGMLPNEDRLTLLPRYKKGEGFIAPEFVYDIAKTVKSPMTAMYSELGPEEAFNMALNVMGGSSVASAPRGALQMGMGRGKPPAEAFDMKLINKLKKDIKKAEKDGDLETSLAKRKQLNKAIQSGVNDPLMPRAEPLTQAEIRSYAERMAPQVAGELTRGADAKTVAGKSQKQFKREQTLPVDRTVLPGAVDPSAPLPYMTLEDQIGSVLLGLPGDPTLARVSLAGIGDVPFAQAVTQHGGPRYGDENKLWASNLSAATGLLNAADRASRQFGDAPVIASYMKMPSGFGFAQHYLETLLQYQRPDLLNKAAREALEKDIKAGFVDDGKRVTFPNFPGFDDLGAVAQAAENDSILRKHIAAKLGTSEKYGLRPAADVQFAVSHPELTNLETGASGFTLGELTPGLLTESAHPTYSHDIPGKVLGQTQYPTPYDLMYRDQLELIRNNPEAPEFNTLKMLGARQKIDDQLVNEINEYQERMRQLLGRKKGGAVEEAEGGLAPYGLRHSGEGVKGKGYFGPMAGREGTVTELSAEDESGEFPLVVPTLTAEEIELLLAGKDPTAEMMEKASSWAATRRKRGESPFASPTEVRMPRPKAEGGPVNLTDLPDEVTPANWREHLQNNVLADARALLGVKDGGVINLDELIEKSLKKKDGGVINLDDLIDWTLAKAEHRKMKEGGAVKMADGGQTFPLQRPEEVTDLKPRPRTKRDELLEMLSKGVGSVHEFMAKPFGYENPPGEMVSSLIGLPGAAKTLERMAYGDPLTSGAGMTTNLLPETTESAMLALGAAPTVLKATKNLPVGLSIKPTDMLDIELASKMKADKIKAPANPVGFYNPAEKAALNLQRKKGPGSAFISDLKKQPGVTDERLAELGLTDLASNPNLTREEVIAAAEQNRIPLRESVRRPYQESDEYSETADALKESIRYREGGIQQVQAELDRVRATAPDSPLVQQYERKIETMRESIARDQQKLEAAKPSLYGPDSHPDYNMPGGENYREIRVGLPENPETQKSAMAFQQFENQMKQKYGGDWRVKTNFKEQAETARLEEALAEKSKNVFRHETHHGDETNVLFHLRVADHVDEEGKRGLLIDELQSDWHQIGRERGYQGMPYTKETLEAGAQMAKRIGYSEDEIAKMTPDQVASFTSRGSVRVPDAPFKDNWYQLGLKRAIKEAADTGMDRVYLTTGARQADRYDLSKQLSSVSYQDGVFRGYDNSGALVVNKSMPPDELPNYVGKDLGKKMVESAKKDAEIRNKISVARYEGKPESEINELRSQLDGVKTEYAGVDLKVGGEGMKQYYDKTYKNYLEKYAKKHGGKLGETKLVVGKEQNSWPAFRDWFESKYPNGVNGRFANAFWPNEGERSVSKYVREFQSTLGNKNETVYYIDITDAMRESAKKGQSYAFGGGVFNTDPDITDSGRIIPEHTI